MYASKTAREGRWSEAIVVGNFNFVKKVKSELGFKAAHREIVRPVGCMRFVKEAKLMGPILEAKVRR